MLVADVEDQAAASNVQTIREAGGTAEAHARRRRHRWTGSAAWSSARSSCGGGWTSSSTTPTQATLHGDAVELSEENWDRAMDVGLKAMFRAAKYAVPHMRKTGGGSMINLSSVHGLLVAPGWLAYETVKTAVIGLTRQMAAEYGPDGIRVNAICPGHIVTERIKPQWDAHPEGLRFFEQQYPVRRYGKPIDIANAIAFLCSAEASFITGQALAVDGGLTLQLQENLGVRQGRYVQQHPDTWLPVLSTARISAASTDRSSIEPGSRGWPAISARWAACAASCSTTVPSEASAPSSSAPVPAWRSTCWWIGRWTSVRPNTPGAPSAGGRPPASAIPALHEYRDEDGLAWLRSFSGLVVTAGLDHTLFTAEVDAAQYHYPYRKTVWNGLHGRVANIPARLLGYGEEWRARTPARCGPKARCARRRSSASILRLRRRIEADLGGNAIRLTDTVTNHGFDPTPHMLLYHINLGWPLVDEGARLVAPIARTRFSTDSVRQQRVSYQRFPAPQPGFVEQVYAHDVVAAEDGSSRWRWSTSGSQMGLQVEWSAKEFPYFFEWLHLREGAYAVGLEPSTHDVGGDAAARADGSMIWLGRGRVALVSHRLLRPRRRGRADAGRRGDPSSPACSLRRTCQTDPADLDRLASWGRSTLLRRLGRTLLVAFGVLVVAFSLIHLIPGDPVLLLLGDQATPENTAELRRALGLNGNHPRTVLELPQPCAARRSGDLAGHPPERHVHRRPYPASDPVAGGHDRAVRRAAVRPAGAGGRARPRRVVRAGVQDCHLHVPGDAGLLLGPAGDPPFRDYPAPGAVAGYEAPFPANLRFLWLPALVNCGVLVPILSRVLQTSLLETLEQEFVETAIVHGLPRRILVWRYLLRPSLAPTVAVLGYILGQLLGAAVVVEIIFGLPGIGTELVNGVTGRDYPVVEGIIFVFGLLVVLISFASDSISGWLDPRTRTG